MSDDDLAGLVDLLYRWRSNEATINEVRAAIAAALEAEREKARARVEAAWDQQCAGYRDMSCESCRAYTDALEAIGGAQ